MGSNCINCIKERLGGLDFEWNVIPTIFYAACSNLFEFVVMDLDGLGDGVNWPITPE